MPWTENANKMILFSNDSDLVPAISSIKERYPSIILGVVTPVRDNQRPPAVGLEQHSDWLRHGISAEELMSSQLPDKVKTRKRSISKPDHW